MQAAEQSLVASLNGQVLSDKPFAMAAAIQTAGFLENLIRWAARANLPHARREEKHYNPDNVFAQEPPCLNTPF
ncbi:hypothetical protein [Methylomonas rapida]|uniref:Uncharacterized protein n=1 Tax=Methylomonas rapida TaxID=2963939 RepID=A0ABY7GL11_9GAMM|nr:hypothetical protein [Methylomonas rapida]WAR45205.1 hypothetical protein NM686_001460 [Methylomonas rapida]